MIGGILVVLVSVLVFVGCQEFIAEEQRKAVNQIPIAIARIAAEDQILKQAQLLKWDGSQISTKRPITFYDFKGMPFGYMFEVVKNGEYAGYVTISARIDFFPLLESSSAPMPVENLKQCENIAIKELGGPVGEPTLMYLRMGDYLARFTSKSGEKSIVISLTSKMIVPEEELEYRQTALEKKAKEIQSDAEAAWSKYISR